MRTLIRAALLVGAALSELPSLAASQDAEASKNAKALFFDRKYDAARTAWVKVAASAPGTSDAITAVYWIAQCSEKLGQNERALGEYAQYLAKRPAGQLAEDARTSRVRIATRLVKAGKNEHVGLLSQGLGDSNRTVRYYSALQMCSLGSPRGDGAVGTLQALVRDESDPDLVERAKLCLVKLGASREARAATPSGGTVRWFRVEITRNGKKDVAVSMPLGLADLVLKSLPDEAREELRKKGLDAESLLGNLKSYPGKDLVDIVGEDGERIRIWIE